MGRLLAVLGFVLGVAGGAAGAHTWVLRSEPVVVPPPPCPEYDDLRWRIDDLTRRVEAAAPEGG
jgi:hypothetical protein